jgi:hypothetical protein
MGLIKRLKLFTGKQLTPELIEQARSGFEERRGDYDYIFRVKTKKGLLLLSRHEYERGSLLDDPDLSFYSFFVAGIFTPDGRMMEHIYNLYRCMYQRQFRHEFKHKIYHPPGSLMGTKFISNFHRPLIEEAYEELGRGELPIV